MSGILNNTSGIKKDLELRQNRLITSAQDNNIENAKRYTSKDLNDFIRDTKDKSFILNSVNPTNALWDYEQHKLCKILSGVVPIDMLVEITNGISFPLDKTKTNDIRDVVKATKNGKSTILQLNLLDIKRVENPQKIKIKYPAGLLDEFIQEYQKIIKWLEDNQFDVLTLLNSEQEIHISQREFENAVRFLEKMKLVSNEIR